MDACRRSLLAASLLPLLARPAGVAGAERPIRLVVPFAPGGATDLIGRAIAEGMAARLGQAVVVENLSGAGGNIGAAAVARARPDGLTLLLSTPGPLAINEHLYRHLAYDPAGFAPVGLAVRVANAVMVHPALPVRDVAGLVAHARAHPGALAYGSAGIGTTSHLAAALLAQMAGLEMVHVPFRGTGPALVELMAGRVPLLVDGVPAALGPIREGRVRALAVTTAAPWFALPDLPTVAASGLPGYEASAWGALVAPAGTEPAVTGHLATVLDATLHDPAIAARLRGMGAEPVGGTPEDLARHVAAERAKWREVVRRAGASLE